MRVRAFVRGIVAAAAVLSPAIVAAQTLLPPAAVTSNGVYVWADGSYRNVNLPNYSLGMHGFDLGGSFLDTGPLQSFKPRVQGYGINGGIGFVLPQGSVPVALGSNVRLGLSVGFVDADVSQSGAVNVAVVPTGVFLDGTSAMLCTCTVFSSLATKYSSWRVGLNAASDIQFGQILVTPSLEMLGGRTRTKQSLTQLGDDEIYSANTKLTWTDLGAKLGLGMTMPLAPALEFGAGGTVSIVHRHVNFSGQDFLEVFGPPVDFGTAIDAKANTWAVIPGGQIQLTYRSSPQATIRLFGGLEWDNRIPGIVSPSFTAVSLFGGTPGTPASIGFSGQSSYFVGGGLTYAFNR